MDNLRIDPKWTRVKPIEPGWYWIDVNVPNYYGKPNDNIHEPVNVVHHDYYGLCIYNLGGLFALLPVTSDALKGAYWSRIPEPNGGRNS